MVLDQQICPRSTIEWSEVYSDDLVRLGAVHSAPGVIAGPADESLHLTALQDGTSGPWHETDAVAIAALLPHPRRARLIQGRPHLLEAEQAANGLASREAVLASALARRRNAGSRCEPPGHALRDRTHTSSANLRYDLHMPASAVNRPPGGRAAAGTVLSLGDELETARRSGCRGHSRVRVSIRPP